MNAYFKSAISYHATMVKIFSNKALCMHLNLMRRNSKNVRKGLFGLLILQTSKNLNLQEMVSPGFCTRITPYIAILETVADRFGIFPAVNFLLKTSE